MCVFGGGGGGGEGYGQVNADDTPTNYGEWSSTELSCG